MVSLNTQKVFLIALIFLMLCIAAGTLYSIVIHPVVAPAAKTAKALATPPITSPTFSAPQQALDAYCYALQHRDVQALYALEPKPRRISPVAIKTSFDLAQKADGLTSCIISHLQVNGSTATAKVTFGYGNRAKASAMISLEEMMGRWKLGSV